MQMTVDMYDALHGRLGKAVGRIKPIANGARGAGRIRRARQSPIAGHGVTLP